MATGSTSQREPAGRGTKKPTAQKQSYTVAQGHTVRMGERISKDEQEKEGLPSPVRPREYVGGDTIELTEAEARSMRHALEDAPDLTDAEWDAIERAQEEQDAAEGRRTGSKRQSREEVEEAVRSRRGATDGMPDFGRIPQTRATELMMAANRRQERENRNNPMRKDRHGNFQEIDPSALGGGAPNAAGAGADRPGGPDQSGQTTGRASQGGAKKQGDGNEPSNAGTGEDNK